MRILICGDRNWSDFILIYETLREYQNMAELVIEGGAPGADSLGKMAAESLYIPVKSYPAEWKNYGDAAGPIRNRKMLKEGMPNLVLAFHDDLRRSKGTKDMVLSAQKEGIKTILINSKGQRNTSNTLF